MTSECERLGLVARPITEDVDVETLRQIRNVCKDGFSFDNEEITPEDQVGWWILMRGKVKAWLYWSGAEVVGYGLLRQTEDGRWWSSCAVLPGHAGKGYGGALLADLVRRTTGVVYATARLDNPAAVRLHRSADWIEHDRDERLAHFRTRPHVWHEAAMNEWRLVGAP